jgi:hypothetical protein
MLRITESVSADAARKYFGASLRHGDYYLKGQEVAGRWGGKGAALLGLRGTVEETAFLNLLDNLRPDGRQLTARMVKDRRPGYDFTFDVPKSVSLLHALGGDERIVEAMQRALAATMAELEQEMHTRVRVGGADEDRRTGNMIWADFLHFTSRPAPLSPEQVQRLQAAGFSLGRMKDGTGDVLLPDPHLHVHVYVINATFDPIERKWKAGVFMQAKRDATYFQAAYHTRLAQELQRLGYGIAPTADAFEVVGLDRDGLSDFSRRTQEVEAEAERLGITSAKGKDQLGAKTRRRKAPEHSREALAAHWRAMAAPELLRGVSATVNAAKQRGALLLDSPIRAVEGVEFALGKELERSSEASERRVLASALAHSVGSAGIDSVRSALGNFPGLLRGRVDGEERVSTYSILQEESQLFSAIRSGRGAVQPLVRSAYRFKNDLFRQDSAREQRAAIEAIMGSRDWVFGLIGRAGTGKTTLLKEIDAGLREVGARLIPVAPTAEASRSVLRAEGFAGAETVKRLLIDPQLQAGMRGNVLWIDEAGLLGNRDMLDLLRVAKENGALRVILAGDPTQIRSVPRGDALRFLEERAGLQVARLEKIQRQKNAELRSVIEAVSKGNIGKGFALLDEMGAIRSGTAREMHESLARSYVERVKNGKSSVLAICPTHREGDAITACIRKSLREAGSLSGQDRVIPRTMSLGLTEAERNRAASYAPGLLVQFTQKAKGFARGERARIESVDTVSGRVLARRNDGTTCQLPLETSGRFDVYRVVDLPVAVGEKLRITQNARDASGRWSNGNLVEVRGFTPEGDLVLSDGKVLPATFGHLTHGYVMTADSAQAKTVDSVLVGVGSDSLGAAEMRRIYVALSRARHEARIFTDDKDGLLRAASRDSKRRFAHDLVGEEEQRFRIQDILKHLREQEQASPDFVMRLPKPPAHEEMEMER